MLPCVRVMASGESLHGAASMRRALGPSRCADSPAHLLPPLALVRGQRLHLQARAPLLLRLIVLHLRSLVSQVGSLWALHAGLM
jgi:hypothetical protein